MPLKLDPVWVVANCGTCGKNYTVNARSAPKIGRKTYCRKCWDRAMNLRGTLGWTVYDCPDDTWPDPTSEDPFARGDNAVPFKQGMKLL